MSTMDSRPQFDDAVAPVTIDLVESEATAPSTVILETVLSLSGKEVTEIAPLAETIDPDALDSLFAYDASADGTGSLELAVEEYRVTLRDDGLVRFEDLE
jgi:hypothetical protein